MNTHKSNRQSTLSSGRPARSPGFSYLNGPIVIYFLVAAGFLLRLIILIHAENRLGTDESAVGIMALDILQGKDYPFFFIDHPYNGGAAIEAYITALLFKLFGPSEMALKFCLLMLWSSAALFLADLCRRTLSGNKTFFSVLFFVVGSPFLLEWSLKARSGHAETVLFSIILLWLVNPPRYLRNRNDLRNIAFGLLSGIGLWASEMLLAMIFCAGIWLLVRCDKGERKRTVKMLVLGGIIGLMPLVIYNFTHHFTNLKFSVLWKLVSKLVLHRGGGGGKGPLSLSDMKFSAAFVFGKAYVLIVLGMIVGSVRLIRNRKSLELGHIMLIYTCIYIFAYWISGLRYLPVPPSRVLYSIYPGLAVLLAYAVDISPNAGMPKRVLCIGAVILWLGLTAGPVADWISSGVPREESSWRGSWALNEGDGLYERLVQTGTNQVYANKWTNTSLYFAMRKAIYMDSKNPSMALDFIIPESPEPGKKVAFVLHARGKIVHEVEQALQSNKIRYQRSELKNFVIFSGVDSSYVYRGIGFPVVVSRADWDPLPSIPDGFN